MLRLTQAEPAPAEPPVAPREASGAAATAAPPPATAPAAASAPARAVCNGDSDCGDESICENHACRRIEQRVNVFYLYYQEGSFREVLGLYWAKRGSTGFTVVAPFYWHYWAPKSRSLVVAPLYWHFEDDAAQSSSTVIVPGLPVSWSRQPGARSFGVWPLFYVSTKFGWAAPVLGSFKIADPDKGRAIGAFAFLYWWQRTPTSAFDLGFPFFVSTRSPASAFTFAWPVLNFYWRSGTDDTHTLAIPFFYRETGKDASSTYSLLGYHERTGPRSGGAIGWLYWFGRDRSRDRAHDVVFPLLWSFRSKHSGVSVFFPLVWDFRGRNSRTTVVGPVVHLRDGSGWMNAVVPLWWTAGNSQTAWRFQMLFPLFFWKQSDHGARFSWLTLIGGYSRDEKAGSRTLALLVPPLFFRRDPVREIDVVTPLFIRHRDIEGDSTTRLISLLLYLRNDPRGSTTVVFPLFWRFKDRGTGAAATALLPLFFHRSGPRDTTTFIGPFYWRRLVDGGWGAGIFPVAYFGQRGDASHAVVFPFFWRFTNAKSGTTMLLPLFFTARDGGDRDSGILPLLTFWGNSGGRSYQVQFPLFWRFADAAAHKSIAVTPLGFFGRSAEGWRAGFLPPLLWAGRDGPRRHAVFFPLFWHFADDARQESTTVATLYWHRRRGGETTDALFPLLYYRRGARPGGTDETSFTLFPFVHYRRDGFVRLLVTPLGASVRGPRRAAGFVGPYFWYSGPTITASGVPLLYADVTRTDTGERTRQWGPVVAIDAADRHTRVVVPFFGRYRDDLETDTYVFPSFFRQRKADGYAVDTVLPLYWRSTWRDRTTTVVGPWYRRAGSNVHNTGLVPFYFWAKNPDRTLLVLPPLLTFHRHDFRNSSAVTWVGLFFHNESPGKERTIVFPLWWSGRDGERKHRVLGPIYWHFEDGAARKAWTLLTPFYWSTNQGLRTRALLPVAWYTRDAEGRTASEAVMPLFYSARGPDRFTFLTLLGGVSRTLDARRWYVGPLYVSNSVTSNTRVLFPLYFSHYDRGSETLTRLFVPLLHFKRAKPEKSLSTWLALFWRRSDVTSATTFVLPLFFDVHDYRASRTTVLLPLFMRHSNETTGHTYALAPLFYRHTSPTAATTVLFPLYWDFKTGEQRRTTIVLPLFAHWTRPRYAGTYVFPIFYYRTGFAAGAPPRTPDGTWRLFIPPLFDAAVQRPGDLRWELLGGIFGKERIGRNHYLKVLFMTFETQKASAAQTSWYGQPKRPSRAHPTRGLAVSDW